MSRYAPVNQDTSPPATPSRRTSFHSIRSFRLNSGRSRSNANGNAIPDPDEMDAAFDGPDNDDADADENHGLLGRNNGAHHTHSDQNRDHVGGEQRTPGDYDFERDYTLPPSSPPPFQPYSSHNPAPGNSNGILPTTPAHHPTQRSQRHFLGGILPSSFLPARSPAASAASRFIGAGSSGVFGNLAARPDNPQNLANADGPEYAPEHEQKEGPPSYQAALRDAVPPYWDTTVVLPSSSSPFGPLSSSMSGDEILIDGMPGGNFFGFFWNLIVSFSFQFVGFLLTYVLHTTHAAKYGSRVGLGMTLISIGLNLRSKAEDLINTGRFPTDPSDPDPPKVVDEDALAENAIEAIWGPGGPWPYPVHEPNDPNGPITILHNTHEAEDWAHGHNMTLAGFMGLPNAEDVGRANEYFSFMMMSIGWFIVLTSLGGWWRVKRFERGLQAARRESENAQAQANSNRDGSTAVDGEEGVDVDGEGNLETITTAPTSTRNEARPNELRYYTLAFSQAWDGARDLQRGFFGMHGRPLMGRGRGGRGGRGNGHTPLNQDDGEEGDDGHELLDAQGFGLGPMALDPTDYPGVGAHAQAHRERRNNGGLWGV
ncbi:uncharacterized protein I303_103316 [Kwoniella dejecticola CBS 10117]|uniref:Metal homeostatis protein bsd2 n=1 Tax=Kwoniella dejecticola CBS 10117 TaxID=1296121 RepID=A0A1A6A6E7_9TREE|nr:metal homeostatis protein bsd2 [Kwoniella dejecticola CBS 10117]OBR85628.1 metal homeostatis protein bsd2 [Kwoniella dejecticola CBS 10117]